MPPNTRSSSSAQSSPAMATRSQVPSANTTPLATPTRKTPQCSICKRPRVGHPRSGCPYGDSSSTGNSGGADPNRLTDALGSMVIASPLLEERDEDKKAFARNRRRKSATPRTLAPSASLLSISTDSRDILQRLCQPGILNTPRDEYGPATGGKPTRIIRWQDSVQNISTSVQANVKMEKAQGRPLLPGSIMPGTLIPPTPEGSFAAPYKPATIPKLESPSPSEDGSTDLEDAEQEEPLSGSHSSTPTRRPQPLERTMSSMERNAFISQLDREAPATIHLVPKADIDTIAKRAMDLNFIVRQVMSDDDDDEQALLILGRDEKAVQSVVDKVEAENRKAAQSKLPQTPEKGRSALKTAAGAAVVGAVGAWAGLAFS